jgi:hypothetical protein
LSRGCIGRLDDGFVEGVVRGLPRPAAGRRHIQWRARRAGDQLRRSLPEEPLRLAQPLELLGADPEGRELGGKALDRRPDDVRLLQVQAPRPPHDRPAAREHVHHPTRLELAQCLPDRRPADPELGGERLLSQARARLELPLRMSE